MVATLQSRRNLNRGGNLLLPVTNSDSVSVGKTRRRGQTLVSAEAPQQQQTVMMAHTLPMEGYDFLDFRKLFVIDAEAARSIVNVLLLGSYYRCTKCLLTETLEGMYISSSQEALRRIQGGRN